MLRKVIFAAGVFMVSSLSQGEEAATKLRLGHNVFSYSSNAVESKPKTGTTTKVATSNLDMFAGDFELYINKGPYNAYVFPTQQGSAFWIGYNVIENLELGLTLRLNSTSVDKPKTSEINTAFGVYGIYYHEIMTGHVLELTFNPVFGSRGADTIDDITKKAGKEENGLMQFNFAALMDCEIDTNWHYYFSILFSLGTESHTKPKEVTNTTTTLSITPVGFRYFI